MMHKYINDLKNHFKVETLSGDFDKIYVNTIEQIRDWANEKKVKVEFSLIDAESEGCYLICWRLDGTLKLVALAKKIPGISFSVDCPADVFKGENLLPLLDTGIDIVSFNSSSACSNVIRKAKELKKEIRFYSGGRNRISWGFLPWKHGSTGRIELCNYSFDITPENCFTVSQYTSYLSKGPYFYPKKDGDVICTPAFEMNREGIDDYAYIYTLECAIKKSLESKDGRVAAAAEEAKAFLKKLKDSIPQYADDPAATAPEDQGQLDNWRKEIAERIETLTAH